MTESVLAQCIVRKKESVGGGEERGGGRGGGGEQSMKSTLSPADAAHRAARMEVIVVF